MTSQVQHLKEKNRENSGSLNPPPPLYHSIDSKTFSVKNITCSALNYFACLISTTVLVSVSLNVLSIMTKKTKIRCLFKIFNSLTLCRSLFSRSAKSKPSYDSGSQTLDRAG